MVTIVIPWNSTAFMCAFIHLVRVSDLNPNQRLANFCCWDWFLHFWRIVPQKGRRICNGKHMWPVNILPGPSKEKFAIPDLMNVTWILGVCLFFFWKYFYKIHFWITFENKNVIIFYREDGELEDGEIDDAGLEETQEQEAKEDEKQKNEKAYRKSRKKHKKEREKKKSKRRKREKHKVS